MVKEKKLFSKNILVLLIILLIITTLFNIIIIFWFYPHNGGYYQTKNDIGIRIESLEDAYELRDKGAIVSGDGTADNPLVISNIFVSGYDIGISIVFEGYIVLKNVTVLNCNYGIIMNYKVKSLTLIDVYLSNNNVSIQLNYGFNVTVKNLIIRNSEAGFYIYSDDEYTTQLRIENAKIESDVGFRFSWSAPDIIKIESTLINTSNSAFLVVGGGVVLDINNSTLISPDLFDINTKYLSRKRFFLKSGKAVLCVNNTSIFVDNFTNSRSFWNLISISNSSMEVHNGIDIFCDKMLINDSTIRSDSWAINLTAIEYSLELSMFRVDLVAPLGLDVRAEEYNVTLEDVNLNGRKVLFIENATGSFSAGQIIAVASKVEIYNTSIVIAIDSELNISYLNSDIMSLVKVENSNVSISNSDVDVLISRRSSIILNSSSVENIDVLNSDIVMERSIIKEGLDLSRITSLILKNSTIEKFRITDDISNINITAYGDNFLCGKKLSFIDGGEINATELEALVAIRNASGYVGRVDIAICIGCTLEFESVEKLFLFSSNVSANSAGNVLSMNSTLIAENTNHISAYFSNVTINSANNISLIRSKAVLEGDFECIIAQESDVRIINSNVNKIYLQNETVAYIDNSKIMYAEIDCKKLTVKDSIFGDINFNFDTLARNAMYYRIENVTVAEKEIVLVSNQRGIIVNQGLYIIILNSRNVIVEGVNASKIIILLSADIIIRNSNVSGSDIGIYAYYGSNISIINCSIVNNTVGIYYYRVYYGYIINNIIADNKDYGLILNRSSGILVSSNRFEENGRSPQAYSDDSNTFVRNYWSDYEPGVLGGQYELDGGGYDINPVSQYQPIQWDYLFILLAILVLVVTIVLVRKANNLLNYLAEFWGEGL